MQPASRLKAIYHVTRDMDRAEAFYRNAFGMTVVFRDGSAWCQLSLGGQTFALSSPGEAAAGASGAVAVFDASSDAGVRRRIEASGGRLVGERDMGAHGHVTTYADPDGTLFQVFQREAVPGGD